ncbi:leucine-rich repeat protein [Gordonibacter sp.]|uniref:leucine-rich repeat protein n=1 Tax=Gordonibacter sp. TaxID=1968902 RepID=UPI0025BC40E2|nr:leucine-rich repeat protein [Gordonibacter sp.]
MEEVTDSSNSSGDTAQFSQQVPLDQPSNENKNESAPAQVAGSSDASGQVAGTVVLPADANAVSIVSDGLVFEIDDTTKTATLVGSAATPPKGDLLVPASVTSGTTTYEVTAIAKNVFAKCSELTSVSLPATLREVDPDALMGCTSLKSITVSAKNETFVSHDGMLFTKDYSRLLLIPEGMEGAANIPGSTTTVPAQALSRCYLMGSSLTAGDGSAAFTTLNGMLFSKDLKTLVSCPPAIGNAVVLPAETETIGEYALAGCKDLTSITALGNVREIDATAFTEEVIATAKVALPARESKAVWEQVGFQHFAETAEPGATSRPEADAETASGLMFTLLDDYTLSVTWEGAEDPMPNLEIPASAEINGVSYRVSTIAANAFANRGSLTSVKLPTSISIIGETAFAGCANLTDIQLSGNLFEIGERAFEATSLTNIWLPASVQFIGPRAFASSDSLTRIVTLGTPEVADDALASCANLSVYCPYNAEGTYPWNLGLLANNNHLLPYGLAFSEEPLSLEVGQQANLFEGGTCEAPSPVELSFSYAAKPLSVDEQGTTTAKAEGTSEVTATLTLNNQELTRATRTVEVTAAPEPPEALESPVPATPDSSSSEQDSTNDTPHINETHTLTSNEVPANDAALANLSLEDESNISLTAALTTGESFQQRVPSGQMLIFTILASDTPSVEVAAVRIGERNLDGPGDVVIPATVTNSGVEYSVARIAERGFNDFGNLTSLTFAADSRLESFGYRAVYNCENLTYVEIPEGVTTLEQNALAGNMSLKSLTIPNSVTSLGEGLFLYNCALRQVTLGQGVTALPDYLFDSCTALETINVLGNVTTFSTTSFYRTVPFQTEVQVPAGDKETWINSGSDFLLKNIVEQENSDATYNVVFDAAGGYPATMQLSVPQGKPMDMPSISRDGYGLEGWYVVGSDVKWNFNDPITDNLELRALWVEKVYDEASGLKFCLKEDGTLSVGAIDPLLVVGDFRIPESYEIGGLLREVSEVEPGAFHSASDLERLVLPKTIRTVGVHAFSRCKALKEVIVEQDSVLEVMESDAFSNCASLTHVVLPDSLRILRRAAFLNCKKLDTVEIGAHSKLEVVGDQSFINCAALKSFDFPATVKRVEYAAFKGTGLTQVNLPENLESLGIHAFLDCVNASSLSLPSKLTVVENEVFQGCSNILTIHASSSLSHLADALKSTSLAVFDPATRDGATIVLPAKSKDGSETYEDMKREWEGYGFSKFSPMGGPLPLANDIPGSPNTNEEKAGWTLSSDGTLTIHSIEKIANLAWDYKGAEMNTQYWGPVRLLVTAVDTTGIASVDTSTACWFRSMPNLVDISRAAKIPDGVTDANNMFAETGITSIPAELSFPQNIEVINALFNKCLSLKSIPDWFNLPEGIKNCGYLFGYNPNLTGLPASFHIPSTVEQMAGFFRGWTSLTEVPSNFVFPDNVQDVTSLFEECSSLASLPADFKIPETVTEASYMFRRCNSLASLPEKFSMPQTASSERIFYSDTSMPLYYAGNDSVLLRQSDEWWSVLNRTLITPANRPEGASTITLNIKTAGEAGEGMFWSAVHTDASGLLAEPAYVPSRPGMVFTLWYTDPECTQRVDFSKLFNANTTIYGKLSPGTLGGTLPCVAGTGSAAWSLPDDGTLYLRGAGKVDNLDWSLAHRKDPSKISGHWLDYRKNITRVSMTPSLRANNVNCWFAGAESLTDVSEFSIPRGVNSTKFLFYYCYALESLPDGFTIPEGVTNAMDMFTDTNLRALPEGFSLPSTLSEASDMFNGLPFEALPTNFRLPEGFKNPAGMFANTALVALPDGFLLPESTEHSDYMFYNCPQLRSLPRGFTIPQKVTDVNHMFAGCSSLAALPDGFSVLATKPATWGDAGYANMFEGCTQLTSLPADMELQAEVLTDPANMFFCDIAEGGARIPAYYAGSNETVLNYDWTSQNRTLITTGEGAADKGLYPVEYKVMNPDTNVFETSASAFTTGDGLVPDLGTLQKLGYGFIGWFADEDCLEAFDFSRPVTGATTLYAKWAKHGGKDTDEGILPTENPDVTKGQDAWWGIATDGALHIACENGSSVANLGFKYDVQADKYWEPYLNDVYSLRMERKVRAQDMTSWFKRMTNLTTIDKGFFFPENCVSARWLFYYNTGLQTLSQGFFDGAVELKDIGGMLQGCAGLATLPDDFVLPTTIDATWCLFYGTSINTLPEGFKLHENLAYFNSMFAYCKNLTTLPEDFKIPSTASDMKFMFYTCPKLTALPAHLFENVIKMPADGELRKNLKQGWDVFGFKDGSSLKPDPDPLPTYFPASNEEIALIEDWSAQHRTIVKADDSNRQHIASLRLPDDAGAYPTVWKRLYANKSNIITVEPSAAPRAFQTFKGWYLNEECTNPATFPLTLGEDIYLYALYETTGGTLPTINPDGTEGQGAQWLYDQDTHVLKIEATVPGAKIKKLFQTPSNAHSSPTTGYWSPFRAQVEKVQMSDGLLVGGDDGVSGDMDYWFSGMQKLTSLDGVYVPEGTVSLDHTFNVCTSLTALPETFTLPDSVTDMTGTFRRCKLKTLPDGFKLPPHLKEAVIIFGENFELESLPEGFALPEGVNNAHYLFWNCSKLKQLPSSFLLPEGLSNASAMFGGCAALTSLPAGFTIPASTNQEKKIDLSFMFSRCATLATLPEGFSIGDLSRVATVFNMFESCSSLTSLPASLDLTGLQGVSGVETLFAPAADATEVTTYYAGSDLAKLSVDGGDATAAEAYWKDNYKRNLVVTNGGTSMPEGTCTVNFMIPDTTGNSNYTLWQSVVVARGSTLVDPQLASRYGVAFEGWFDGEGKEVVFGTTIEPNTPTMTLYARFTAPILKATAPASAKITVDASGTITKAPLRLTSQTAAPVWVSQAVATPNIEADTAVKPSALADLSLVMRPPIGKGTLVIFLDGGISRPTRDDTFTIPTATGVATPGVLDCSIDVEGLNPADVLFHRDGLSTGLADITFTFELAK